MAHFFRACLLLFFAHRYDQVAFLAQFLGLVYPSFEPVDTVWFVFQELDQEVAAAIVFFVGCHLDRSALLLDGRDFEREVAVDHTLHVAIGLPLRRLQGRRAVDKQDRLDFRITLHKTVSIPEALSGINPAADLGPALMERNSRPWKNANKSFTEGCAKDTRQGKGKSGSWTTHRVQPPMLGGARIRRYGSQPRTSVGLGGGGLSGGRLVREKSLGRLAWLLA